MLKKTTYILVLLLTVSVSAQTKQTKDERAIADVLRDIQLDMNSSIVEGNRVFVMSPKSSVGVSPYLKDRLREGIIEAIGNSKYQLVFQPYLEDNTAKKITVSDTLVRVQQFSTLTSDYGSMRSLIDTLNAYSIDVFVASRIQKSEDGHVIVHLQMVKTKNLEVLSTRSYYSNKSAEKTSKGMGFSVGAYTGESNSSLAYRNYTNLSNGSVGPYNVNSYVNGIYGALYQDLIRTSQVFQGGLIFGAENSFVREGFVDTLYQSHSFSIPAFSIGLSLKASLNSAGSNGRSILSVEERVFLGKPSLIDQYLVSETRLIISLTEFLDLFGSVRYSQPVAFSSSVQQILEFQSYSLCYGVSVNI